ncbi:hypothetical protein Bbelb_222260 [Branchiostoma belcheri]|nr:hypothetical protein Bbelb_222260 [Branchiostoma belcheri]
MTERRGRGYLRTEFAQELQRSLLEYRLQIQLHEWVEGDPYEIFNPAYIWDPKTHQFDSHVEGDPYEIFNPACIWDPKTHPWLELARVCVTNLLPQSVLERTVFDPSIQPPSLGLLEPKSSQDHNSLPHLNSDLHARPMKPGEGKLPVDLAEGSYAMEFHTGVQRGAGTTADVWITLTGTWLRTDRIKMEKSFFDEFERGAVSRFHFKSVDVEEVLLVTLESSSKGFWHDWYVENVFVNDRKRGRRYEFPCHRWIRDRVVLRSGHGKTHVRDRVGLRSRHVDVVGNDRKRGRRYEFPCHRWIRDRVVLRSGHACLNAYEFHDLLAAERQLEVQDRQRRYKWSYSIPGCPGHLYGVTNQDLPRDVRLLDEKSRDFGTAAKRGSVKTFFKRVFGILRSLDDFKDLANSVTSKISPHIMEDWHNDVEFGRQFLNGITPSAIRRCRSLPANFGLRDEMVQGCFDDKTTLSEEIEAGHIYIVDCGILDGLEPNSTKGNFYFAAPLALFHVNRLGDFLPIAIQLNQRPGNDNPVFTSEDSDIDWLMAKIFLRNADAQLQLVVSHLLDTHLVMEPFAVATYRQLPGVHPLYKLLVPHFRGMLGINVFVREALLKEGGVLDDVMSLGPQGRHELLRKCYKAFNLRALDLPASLKDRGLDDFRLLPGYRYRDDGMMIWGCIEKFVTDMLSLHYDRDAALQDDLELQRWISDVYEHGFNWEDNQDRGIPHRIKSLQQLHAAVNGGARDTYGFVPNAPLCLRRPPPPWKGIVGMTDIVRTLPDMDTALLQTGIADMMCEEPRDEVYLSHYPERHFIEENARAVIDEFQYNITAINDAIAKRNTLGDVPNTYLLPQNIPNSISR